MSPILAGPPPALRHCPACQRALQRDDHKVTRGSADGERVAICRLKDAEHICYLVAADGAVPG